MLILLSSRGVLAFNFSNRHCSICPHAFVNITHINHNNSPHPVPPLREEDILSLKIGIFFYLTSLQILPCQLADILGWVFNVCYDQTVDPVELSAFLLSAGFYPVLLGFSYLNNNRMKLKQKYIACDIRNHLLFSSMTVDSWSKRDTICAMKPLKCRYIEWSANISQVFPKWEYSVVVDNQKWWDSSHIQPTPPL